MRRALQQQRTNTSIIRPFQRTSRPPKSSLHTVLKNIATTSNGSLNFIRSLGIEQQSLASDASASPNSLATESPEPKVPIRKQLSLCRSYRDEVEGKKSEGLLSPRNNLSLSKDRQNQTIWSSLLDKVRTHRRHSRSPEAWALYLGIVQNRLSMPTEGKIAAELWEHFIQIGSNHSKTSWIVAEYAIDLHKNTGTARPDFYQNIVGNQLWRSPYQALKLHQLLKTKFPPDGEDFKALLRLSLHAGNEAFKILRKIYIDHPVPNLYSVVVPELCKRDMRTEATNWHFLLVERRDLPQSFHDCKPLFMQFSHIKNDKVVEALAKSLMQRQLWYEKDVDNFVREDKFISREIMNRALGEAHQIAPKSLSDNFCARLFATQFFSVAMVISGLQIMGLESLGPLALREIAVRDEYHCEAVTQHIQMLREGGVSLQHCKYNITVEKAASTGQAELLKSMASTDLHPDTFEDIDLQERLLVLYCKTGDHMQTERTLAVFRSTTPEQSWEIYRANLLLRCHISLRNRPQVISVLKSMQKNQYPLAPRSSRHLRVAYLSPKRGRVQLSDSQKSLEDITLIINVMIMSLSSGYSIPLEAWKEILKRLGMMGHLDRYQGLALWLVDWYARPIGSETPRHSDPNSAQTKEIVPWDYRGPIKSSSILELIDHKEPIVSQGNAEIQNRDLLKLFGKDAQQAIVAWGFQAEIKRRPNSSGANRIRYADPKTHWQWGLRLLKELQFRGVPINKFAIARAFKLRLLQLFNVSSVSRNSINRRAKALNDERSKLMAKFRYGAYIKGLEDIWGRELLNYLADSPGPGSHLNQQPTRKQERLIRYTKAGRKWRTIM